MVYYVSENRGVASPDHRVLKPGDKIPETWDPKWVAQLVKSGHVREGKPGPSDVDIYASPTIQDRGDEDTGIAPGEKDPPFDHLDPNSRQPRTPEPAVPAVVKEVDSRGKTFPDARRPHGKTWVMTDEQLRGKSLNDMNSMIVERGGKPMATIEEAVQRLQSELR